MTINTVTRLIQLMIVPVVMVTACALLINGILQQYASINDRLRLMARERLELWHPREAEQATPMTARDAFITERLEQIDTQLPQLLQRHHLVYLVLSQSSCDK